MSKIVFIMLNQLHEAVGAGVRNTLFLYVRLFACFLNFLNETDTFSYSRVNSASHSVVFLECFTSKIRNLTTLQIRPRFFWRTLCVGLR